MNEHVDVDISAMLTDGMSVQAAGEQVVEMLTRVANGRLTCNEVLGHREFAPIPVGP